MNLNSNYPVQWVHGHHDIKVSGKRKSKLPPLEILKWLFRYDSETGELYRVRFSSGKAINPEREITTTDGNGYLVVGIIDSNRVLKLFRVHQICYYIHFGKEPLQIVDHIDGDKLNNRPNNIRLSTEQMNVRNSRMNSRNTSGFNGVSYSKRDKKWVCQYYLVNGKSKNISFSTKEEAIAARIRHEREVALKNPKLSYSVRHGMNEDVSASV